MLHTAALQMVFYLVASLILFPIICVVALGSRIFRASPSYECHSHVNFVTVDNVMTLPIPRLPTTQQLTITTATLSGMSHIFNPRTLLNNTGPVIDYTIIVHGSKPDDHIMNDDRYATHERRV